MIVKIRKIRTMDTTLLKMLTGKDTVLLSPESRSKRQRLGLKSVAAISGNSP
jgi:hypothetical protein